MRIGMNPARHRRTSFQPARVTVAVLVYIPHLGGYFEHRLEVLKLCLGSLLTNTRYPYDLLIFDNASCQEVKDYINELAGAGSIDFLISSSVNVGKLGALWIISGAAPGELIAYSDDDTFFYPGWLERHVMTYDAFPNVGMVSGCPERTLFDHGIQSNLNLAERDPEVSISFGKTIPEEWEIDWARALGRDIDSFLRQVRERDDIILERKGFSAYATASHNQFLIPRAIAQKFFQKEWTGRLMGGMTEFDNAVDRHGYLRLTTINRTTRLIGNIVDENLASEAKAFSIDVDRIAATPTDKWRWLARWKPLRRFLQGVYNRLFWILSEGSGGWYSGGGPKR